MLDRHRVVVAANTAFTTITGYRQEDAIGQRDNLLLSKPPGENYYQRVFDQLQDAESGTGDHAAPPVGPSVRCSPGGLQSERTTRGRQRTISLLLLT
ncbi:MAG: PAS domain-containing protein [Gammaproteobacteria bacterium]|nr:PAS domain-containing protein [Gammaproteobacteria bacterium]